MYRWRYAAFTKDLYIFPGNFSDMNKLCATLILLIHIQPLYLNLHLVFSAPNDNTLGALYEQGDINSKAIAVQIIPRKKKTKHVQQMKWAVRQC